MVSFRGAQTGVTTRHAAMTAASPCCFLWLVVTWLTLVSPSDPAEPRTCEEVQIRCAQRKGCGSALHAYLSQCAGVVQAGVAQCPALCQRALAALTSTDEGRGLSDCNCGDSEVCRRSKVRIEVCRESVEKLTAPGARIPCSVAFWMCEAEPQCGTALAYYYRYCHGAFRGKRCTSRCNNSLAILNRQPRADTLRSCYCDGTEDFHCQKIKDRTNQLCYGKQDSTPSTTAKPKSGASSVCVAWTCVAMLWMVVAATVFAAAW